MSRIGSAKAVAKRILGPGYDRLVLARHSEAVRALSAATGYRARLRVERFNRGAIAIDLNERMGAGAVISAALRVAADARARGLECDVVSTNPLYASHPGEDWLATVFERPGAVERSRFTGQAAQSYLRRVAPQTLRLDEAHDLFVEQFPVRPELVSIADDLGGGIDLSIHFRGTDKNLESGELAIDWFIDTVRRLPELSSVRSVFLATDVDDFEVALKSAFPAWEVRNFNLGTVAAGIPRHFSELDGYAKAKEAAVNMLALARAPVCIRTSSYLSSISRIINPNLRTITVNRTRSKTVPFPEDQILESERRSR